MTNPTPLSPATQAVLYAVIAELDWDAPLGPAAAAALRAAADQVISSVSPPCEDFDEFAQGFLAAHIKYRDEFCAIADELEGSNG